jgi:predicted transcriptional regulator
MSTDSGRADAADNDQEANAQLVLMLTTLRAAGAAGLSLARLSKRCQLPMSTLRRLLSALEEAGILTFSVNETGRGDAALTEEGKALADALAGPAPGDTPDASSL